LTEVTVDPQERFQEFLKHKERRRLIKQMANKEERSLTLNFIDLTVFDDELGKNLLKKPDVYLQYAEEALQDQMKIEDEQYTETAGKLHVRFKEIPVNVPLRTLGAKNIEQLTSVEGIVVRATPVRPLLMEAVFKCRCGEESRIIQQGAFVRRPARCPACRRESGFELIPEKSKFQDSQELRVQERPEDLPPGQLPRYVGVSVVDDIVDCASPGDRVTITGVVRAKPEVIPGKGRLRTFTIYIDANCIETVGKEFEAIEISPEDETAIKKIAKSEFIHQNIMDSIAPSIYGYEHVKEAIMYLLFSGVPKKTEEGVHIRGDIHILLVGDPGTAKSQILRTIIRITPRGLYTSGRGTTAAGLTAAVLRERTGGMVLEAGALVLADKGIAAVDEIDKMRDEDRVAMHEMMEQQTVSIAKGGIIATLNARASILAAANPKLGRYEDRLTAAENINIPIVILSRFDLIFVGKDTPEKDLDERLSDHILKIHRTGIENIKSPISSEMLRKYISYARSRVEPKLSEEAIKHLKQFYLKMRKESGGAEGSPIAITPRQLEALVRLSEARARAALRKEVNRMDADAAIKIMQRSLQDVGALSDIDTIMTGIPTTMREGQATIIHLVGEMEKETGEVNLEELYSRLETEYKVDRQKAEDYIKQLLNQGTLYTPTEGHIKKA